MTYTWNDNFEPYLNVMCNYKQYLDRQYAEITALREKLGRIIPQDFSAGDMFSDKDRLRPCCDVLLQICDLEEKALPLLG